MNHQHIVNSLKKSVLFQALPKNALEDIASQVKYRQFFKEETVVWQGKPSDSLYLIVNGIVAVQRAMPNGQDHILAYLMAGNTFGEVGILENQARSANIVAMSEVDTLVIRRNDFLEMLHNHPTLTIELAKMLAKYLSESNRRAARGNKNAKLILLFNMAKGASATSTGCFLAKILVEKTKQRTLFMEYPNPQQIITDMGINKRTKIYNHEEGFDVLASLDDNAHLPHHARMTLLLDNILKEYDNVIITLPALIDESIASILDDANQIILLSPPLKEMWQPIEEFKKQLKKHIRPEEALVFAIANRNKAEYKDINIDEPYDYEIPYIAEFPSLRITDVAQFRVPQEIYPLVTMFVDRLDRTNQIGVFIPTTLDVDKKMDTSTYVEQTLNFLAERFGGATSKEVSGVWNSDKVGLVGEKVFVVHTYVTPSALNQYLDEVIEYVKELKIVLKQEAMALEVNRKLTLI
jgi:CRP-like cAMP-binding protein